MIWKFQEDGEEETYKELTIKRIHYSVNAGCNFEVHVGQFKSDFVSKPLMFDGTVDIWGYKIRIVEAMHLDFEGGESVDIIQLGITCP